MQHPLNSRGIQWLRRSQGATQKLMSWIEAMQSGVFMGLVDDQSYLAFDTYPFDETAPMDIAAETERGLEPWERRAVRDQLGDAKSILVVAAGGARELVGLHDLGYDTMGVEYGRELCDATRHELDVRKCKAAMQWSERFEVPRGARLYDAAFIARKFFSHVHDRRCRIQLLANIRRTLQPSARLVFGYYTRDRDTLAFRLQAKLANILRMLRGRHESLVEVGDHLDPHSPLFHHHFDWEELQDELQAAGFTPIEHEATWFGWCVARSTANDASRQTLPFNSSEISEAVSELVETR